VNESPTQSRNRFHRLGFLHIPPDIRNLYYDNGTPALLVADTPWAMPSSRFTLVMFVIWWAAFNWYSSPPLASAFF
jgi:hypothetical protein